MTNPDNYTDEQLDRAYSALNDATEFWIVVGRGAFAFRFGPFTPKEAGEHMKTALERRVAITIIGQCGREIDWNLAEDLGCRLAPSNEETGAADSAQTTGEQE